ncbi:MAG: DUF4382 domain-containing protein [Nitrospirota bacterium]|jgi:hypothetical protein
MRSGKHRFLAVLGMLLALGLLFSCGGGDGTGSGVTGQTGSVAVLMTDGPADMYSAINVTITRIVLLSDTMPQEVIFSGEKTVNLLDLRDDLVLVTLDSSVPAGTYDKIRLEINNVEILDTGSVPVESEIRPSTGKIDLNPRGRFSVAPGETLTVGLDFDAEKSLHIFKNPRKIIFRPVIFVDIVSPPVTEKLVRAEGQVDSINRDNDTFKLCSVQQLQAASTGSDNTGFCIDVALGPDTSFFSSPDDGMPAAFGDLRAGDHVTVIGLLETDTLRAMDDNDLGDDVNLFIQAEVVEIGQFLVLTGAIVNTSALGADRFDFDPDADQAVAGTRTVQLQDGTKIFAGTTPLTKGDLVEGERARLDAKLTGEDILNASLILLERDITELSRLSGEVQNVNETDKTFDLITPEITDPEDPCVKVDPAATEVLEITDASGGQESALVDFSGLDEGDQVDVYFDSTAPLSDGCIIPELIVIFTGF